MKVIILLVLIFTIGMVLYSQEENQKDNDVQNFQRNSLIRGDVELKVESSLRYWFENLANKSMYTLNPSLVVEFSFMKYHTIKATGSYVFSLYDDHEARNRVYYAPGDVILSYDYFKQIDHINLFFGPQISIPLGINNEYSIREGILNNGAGRYTVGGNITIIGVRDPIVWNGEFSYKIGLPKKERFATTLLPGIMQLSIGLSHLLNERFGFNLSLQQMITLPEIRNGTTVLDSFSFLSTIQLEMLILFEKNYIRVAIEPPVYPREKPFMLNLIYGHIFSIK